MDYRILPPPPPLQGLIKAIWLLEGDQPSDRSFVYRLMADGFPEIAFQYRNRFSAWQNGQTGETLARSLVQGPTQHFQDMEVTGSYGLIGICMFPFACEIFTGVPARELTENAVDVHLLLGQPGRDLEEQLCLAPNADARLKLVYRFLMEKWRDHEAPDPRLQSAVLSICQAGGQQTIEELAADSGWSNRQFERRFTAANGMRPKLFSRIVRFQRALKRWGQPIPSLAALAYDCGYADQSHFIREFRILSGVNPKTFFNIPDEVADTFVQLPNR